MSVNFDRLLQEGVPESLPKGPIDFVHMFDEYAANNQKTWSHDRTKSVGASECFGCVRKNWFSKRGAAFGYEKDSHFTEDWGAVRRGDLIENYHVVPAVTSGLERRGMKLIMAGEDQDTLVSGNSSATLDGLVIGAPLDALSLYGVKSIGNPEFVLEIKSFGPRIGLKEEKAIHKGQAMMQMGIIRELTEHRPEYAVILYVQASWLDDIRPFIVKWDPQIFELGKARNDKVFNEDNPKLLAPEGKLSGLCAYCAYTNACADVNAERVPEATKPLKKKEVEQQDIDFLNSLETKVLSSAALKKKIKEYELRVGELNEEIKQTLIKNKKSRAVGDGWKVSYTLSPGRSTLSKEAMIAAGLDPDDYVVEGNGFEKLTITT